MSRKGGGGGGGGGMLVNAADPAYSEIAAASGAPAYRNAGLASGPSYAMVTPDGDEAGNNMYNTATLPDAQASYAFVGSNVGVVGGEVVYDSATLPPGAEAAGYPSMYSDMPVAVAGGGGGNGYYAEGPVGVDGGEGLYAEAPVEQRPRAGTIWDDEEAPPHRGRSTASVRLSQNANPEGLDV